MWRQGDVLIAAVETLPKDAKAKSGAILAYGEATGHRHQFADPETVALFEADGLLFVKVIAAEATLIHEEHRAITLPQGLYHVWQQREYTPQQIRRLAD